MNAYQKIVTIASVFIQLNVMAQVQAPGVFVEEIRTLPASVAQVESAIPVFIGYTEKADNVIPGDLFYRANRISSFSDFERFYGRGSRHALTKVVLDRDNNVIKAELARGPFLLYESLQHYFENGGGSCYIISTGNYYRSVQKADFIRGLDTSRIYDEITLLTFPDAVNLPGTQLYEVQQKALQQSADLGDRFCILDLKYAETKSEHNDVVSAFRSNINGKNLKYGAAYTPHLRKQVSQTVNYRNWKDLLWLIDVKTSLRQLTTDSVLLEKLTQLETAIATNHKSEKQKERELMELFPAMKKIAEKLKWATLALPPSGAIAGVYCTMDRTRGVWKAPANVNLSYVSEVAYSVSDGEQDGLNVDAMSGKSINAIRPFTGRGIQVWGARTLAGNDNEWRYVPVRRLFIMIEESVKKSVNRFVFEPNDATTWMKIKAIIENYLLSIWREGALTGNKPEQAFYVKTGLGVTMTALDILEGRMIIEVGLAPVRPAEFIILKFSLKMVER